MIAKETLILLVDALPYLAAQEMTALKDWNTVLPLRPGFGFSVNLDAELFAGVTPDQAGYFNEWTYDPVGSPFQKIGWVSSVLDAWSSIYPFDRILHRIIGKMGGRNLGNIPFAQLHLFNPFCTAVWDPSFPRPTLFSEFPDIEVLAAHLLAGKRPGLGGRDANAVALALKSIQGGRSVFLYLVDLDHTFHEHGVTSAEGARMLAMLNEWIKELSEVFLSFHPDGAVVLLSDHGMANVYRSIAVHLEEVAGPVGPDAFFYFIDSVMLRVWSKNSKILTKVRIYLESLKEGNILTSEERVSGGLTNSAWGDLIFILNEGLVFSPTTYGRGVPKGMHGYHPRHDSQLAVFAYRGREPLRGPFGAHGRDLKTVDVYSILKSVINVGGSKAGGG